MQTVQNMVEFLIHRVVMDELRKAQGEKKIPFALIQSI